MIGGFDTESLKQHFGKKLMELEDEKKAVEVVFFQLWRVPQILPGLVTHLLLVAAREGPAVC